MDIEWRLALEAVLASHQDNQADAARTLGVSRATVNRWKKGLGVPDFGECLALAGLSHRSPAAVLLSAGHDPARLRAIRDSDAPPRAPISVQQRTIAANYEQWMAVMGPRMGMSEAHTAYWDPQVRTSTSLLAAVEAALSAVPTPPDSIAISAGRPTAVRDGVSGQETGDNELLEDGGSGLTDAYRMVLARVDRLNMGLNRRLAA